MTINELIELRKAMGLTQSELAKLIGLGLRAYQEIEGTDRDLKLRHIQAVERVALREAVKQGNPMLAPESVRRDALDLSRLIRGD